MLQTPSRLLAASVFFLCACSTNPPISVPSYEGGIYDWSMSVKPSSGYLHISGTLTPGANTVIMLKADKNATISIPITITLTDENCDLGHQTSISYYTDKNNILYQYSDNQIPWKSPYELELHWKMDDIIISINGEKLTIEKFNRFNQVNISSSSLLNIKNISYSIIPQLTL